MDESTHEPLVLELLPRLLERMGLLAAKLQVELTRLEGPGGEQAERLDELRIELDELGWLLSLLSAAGEGQPELARHHARGLIILLSFQLGSEVFEAKSAPALEAAGGPRLAWALGTWLQALTPRRVAFGRASEGRWLVRATLDSHRPPQFAPPSTQAWFAAQSLSVHYAKGVLTLDLPAEWLHEDEGG